MAVIAALELDDLARPAPARAARQPDRAHRRFGARATPAAPAPSTAHELQQFLGHLDLGLGRRAVGSARAPPFLHRAHTSGARARGSSGPRSRCSRCSACRRRPRSAGPSARSMNRGVPPDRAERAHRRVDAAGDEALRAFKQVLVLRFMSSSALAVPETDVNPRARPAFGCVEHRADHRGADAHPLPRLQAVRLSTVIPPIATTPAGHSAGAPRASRLERGRARTGLHGGGKHRRRTRGSVGTGSDAPGARQVVVAGGTDGAAAPRRVARSRDRRRRGRDARRAAATRPARDRRRHCRSAQRACDGGNSGPSREPGEAAVRVGALVAVLDDADPGLQRRVTSRQPLEHLAHRRRRQQVDAGQSHPRARQLASGIA